MVIMKNKIDNLGKIPPQDLNIEEAILGALMLESNAIHKVTGIIKEESFYLDSHQKIFGVIKSLSDSNKPKTDLGNFQKAFIASFNIEFNSYLNNSNAEIDKTRIINTLLNKKTIEANNIPEIILYIVLR